MVNQEQIEKFIELRARGFSYEKIAKAIGVSKPTLIKLSRQYEKEIANQKFFNIECLLKRYRLARENKIKFLCKLLDRVNVELLSRDLGKLGVKDLLEVRVKLDEELRGLLNPIKYRTGEKLDLLDSFSGMADVTLNLD